MLWASEGPIGFGHNQIHAGIQHGWFLEERIFVCTLTLVPQNVIFESLFSCPALAYTAPSWQGSEQEQY